MPTLTRVRFRNVVLREVIELMSLTKEGKGKRRGRVSYSQLGINQLGAVYEALLSFRGFFAEEDLYEVQPAPKKSKAAASEDDDDFGDDDGGDEENTKASGQAHDELEVGHFVTFEQLKAYKREEIVPDPGTGKPKCYPKGTFIYRLAGRDREKSASYYTPESLTQCLVKYALKELLPGKSAADILQLKVCEPAMGSAAFLNEVVNQLAQKYLELRQQETGKSIPHEQFATELQKVKMRLADQNVFGVDLNPVAVELAEVSLWLNSIFTPEKGRAFVPWFSQQLVCGNSLIGARRQIYRVNQLPTSTARSAKPRKLWHEHAPEELAWDAELPADAIFHFLLPDPGMAAYNDKVIKELDPEAIERCKRWNKAFVGEAFTEAHRSPSAVEQAGGWPLEGLGRAAEAAAPAHHRSATGVARARGSRPHRDQRGRMDAAEAQRPHPGAGGAWHRCGQHQRAPAAQVGDGLLVCAVVLADPPGRLTAQPRYLAAGAEHDPGRPGAGRDARAWPGKSVCRHPTQAAGGGLFRSPRLCGCGEAQGRV
jgi:hypothetical protein